MRRILVLASVLIALLAASFQVAGQNRPPKLEPLPPPPPPPAGLEKASPEGAEVTITPDKGQIIEEYLVDGKRRVRVRMPNGAEYVLEEDLGDGSYAGQQPGDTRIRVPRWIIIRF